MRTSVQENEKAKYSGAMSQAVNTGNMNMTASGGQRRGHIRGQQPAGNTLRRVGNKRHRDDDMCCRRGAQVLLTHLSVLLAMIAGGALVAVGVLNGTNAGDDGGGGGGGGGGDAALDDQPPELNMVLALPYVAPLMLLLAHLAAAASHTSSVVRRTLLFVYAVCGAVLAVGVVGVAGWAGAGLVRWLHSPVAAATLHRDAELCVWLRPLVQLCAPSMLDYLPKEEMRLEVVCALLVCALAPLVQLVAALLALVMAVGRRRNPQEQSLRRSSSVYFEAGPQHKAPLHEIAAWQ